MAGFDDARHEPLRLLYEPTRIELLGGVGNIDHVMTDALPLHR